MIATLTDLQRIGPPSGLESDQDPPTVAARALLRSSGYHLLRTLQCQVSNGVVTIRGTVPSFFLKQMAQEEVLKLAHVREVKNLVEVSTSEPTALESEEQRWQQV